MNIIDGKAISKKVKEAVKLEVKTLPTKPCLLVILVGNDQASEIYVASKEKACKNTGIDSKTIRLEENIAQKEVINVIKEANADPTITGILVQMPLPGHMNPKTLVDAIDPNKDVDGLHAINQGKLLLGEKGIIPATPKGIMRLLQEYYVDLNGKNATVTMAHSHTENLKELCQNMDIIVSAVGKPKTVTEDMVKEGAIVIDVGINRVLGTLVGDVDYLQVAPKTSRITPVPGGVGPMTIACLLENVLECYHLQND